jgi:hypothetical protein
MNFNLFDWIREGVRRSVLLGVSDAVEQMGIPHSDDEVKEQLLTQFQSGGAGRRQIGTSSRKKLGRSLKDIQTSADKAT